MKHGGTQKSVSLLLLALSIPPTRPSFEYAPQRAKFWVFSPPGQDFNSRTRTCDLTVKLSNGQNSLTLHWNQIVSLNADDYTDCIIIDNGMVTPT